MDRFDKFTDDARKVLTDAQGAAARFHHNYIGTEHLLMGLIGVEDGVGARALRHLGVELPKVRTALEFIIGRSDRPVVGEVGLTPAAKQVIELAIDEARSMAHRYIGTEHLLLGLVRQGDGIAAVVLTSFGITLDKVRQEVIRLLPTTLSADPDRPFDAPNTAVPAPISARHIVDLSHEIVDGMTTHPGIPPPSISTFLTHAASAARYAPGTTFEIGRIDLVANTGTYLDTPAHRFPGGQDLAGLALEAVVDLDGVLVDCRGATERAIGLEPFRGIDVRGRAVLVATGWDEHWETPEYLSDNPFLTESAAEFLVSSGAGLVGIDSLNVDSLADPRRPAHTAILAAGIPLVEHLTGLGALPQVGWRFFAVPPRIRGMATFPVRAFAIVG
jgi:arylformamidase